MSSAEYNKGYRAGIKDREAASQRERVLMQCLNLVMRSKYDWKIGNKNVNDPEGYVQVANDLACEVLTKLNQ